MYRLAFYCCDQILSLSNVGVKDLLWLRFYLLIYLGGGDASGDLHIVHIEVRGQPVEAVLALPFGSQELNSQVVRLSGKHFDLPSCHLPRSPLMSVSSGGTVRELRSSCPGNQHLPIFFNPVDL